jgi:glycosyltransferase involved in cell wall biosynthesis
VGEGAFEIVVCNNNSTDATGELAAAAGATVVFEGHNQIARARNAGAAQAGGEWLIFIDADSCLSPALLAETLRQIRQKNAGGGGAVVAFDTEKLPLHVRVGLGSWNLMSRSFRWAAGSYVFCLRQAWLETGGFEERWYAGEEIPFSRRLKKWCRRHGKRFRIVTSASLVTSSRKLDNYGVWQLCRLLGALAWPGALTRREKCGYWYDPAARSQPSGKPRK